MEKSFEIIFLLPLCLHPQLFSICNTLHGCRSCPYGKSYPRQHCRSIWPSFPRRDAEGIVRAHGNHGQLRVNYSQKTPHCWRYRNHGCATLSTVLLKSAPPGDQVKLRFLNNIRGQQKTKPYRHSISGQPRYPSPYGWVLLRRINHFDCFIRTQVNHLSCFLPELLWCLFSWIKRMPFLGQNYRAGSTDHPHLDHWTGLLEVLPRYKSATGALSGYWLPDAAGTGMAQF